MKKFGIIFLSLIVISPLFLITFVSANDTGSAVVLHNPLGYSDANDLLKGVVDWIIKPDGIAMIIAIAMILFGAFQMIFSGGNEETFKKGRTTILYTAIGYAIILVGWGLTSIIQNLLSQ